MTERARIISAPVTTLSLPSPRCWHCELGYSSPGCKEAPTASTARFPHAGAAGLRLGFMQSFIHPGAGGLGGDQTASRSAAGCRRRQLVARQLDRVP